MRRWMIAVCIFSSLAAGCASIQVPRYLQDKNSSTKQFYAGFERTSQAIRLALSDLGWEIEDEVLPEVYEVSSQQGIEEEILMITKVRQTSFFIGTRYARFNVYIRSNGELSEVELRYMTTGTFIFWKSRLYGNENVFERFFERVDRNF